MYFDFQDTLVCRVWCSRLICMFYCYAISHIVIKITLSYKEKRKTKHSVIVTRLSFVKSSICPTVAPYLIIFNNLSNNPASQSRRRIQKSID